MFDLIVSDGSEDVSIEASALDTGIDADSKLAADSFKRKRRPNLYHSVSYSRIQSTA